MEERKETTNLKNSNANKDSAKSNKDNADKTTYNLDKTDELINNLFDLSSSYKTLKSAKNFSPYNCICFKKND